MKIIGAEITGSIALKNSSILHKQATDFINGVTTSSVAVANALTYPTRLDCVKID